jgi:hypothetical protein
MRLHASIAVLATALAFPLAAWAQPTDTDHCDRGTLNGNYAFRVSGQILMPGAAPVDREGVAMTYFDGRGGLTQVDFVMSDGVPLNGPEDPLTGFHNHESGSYTVNPDCTGMPAANPHLVLMFVLGNGGRVIHTIVSQLFPPGATTPVPASIHSDGERLEPAGPRWTESHFASPH